MSHPSPPHLETGGVVSEQGPSARVAGAFLLLTALVTAVSAIGRIAADADQPTIGETLEAISENTGLYGLGGAARLISGITLIVAASLLRKTWKIRMRHGATLVPGLFHISGGFTAISGLAALLIAMSLPAPLLTSNPDVSRLLESILLIRWLTGKIGFAAAGLALIIESRHQWRMRGALRYMAPCSAILGAGMQFIWIDSATSFHPIVGAAFFIWLLTVGGILFTERTKKPVAGMFDSGC